MFASRRAERQQGRPQRRREVGTDARREEAAAPKKKSKKQVGPVFEITTTPHRSPSRIRPAHRHVPNLSASSSARSVIDEPRGQTASELADPGRLK